MADQATLDLLVRCGVDYAQGYHVGPPGPAAEVFELFGTSRRPDGYGNP